MKKFNRFVTDVKNGIKRRLSSRRLKIQVSVDEFDLLSKKYFLGIKSDIVTFKFKGVIVKFDTFPHSLIFLTI